MEPLLLRSNIVLISAFSRLCQQIKIPRDMEVEILEYLMNKINNSRYKYSLICIRNDKIENIERFTTNIATATMIQKIFGYVKSIYKKQGIECEITVPADGMYFRIKTPEYEAPLISFDDVINNNNDIVLKIPEEIIFRFIPCKE